MSLLHRLAHLLRLNGGKVITYYERGERGDLRLMVGFWCLGCGEVIRSTDRTDAPPVIPEPEPEWGPPNDDFIALRDSAIDDHRAGLTEPMDDTPGPETDR